MLSGAKLRRREKKDGIQTFCSHPQLHFTYHGQSRPLSYNSTELFVCPHHWHFHVIVSSSISLPPGLTPFTRPEGVSLGAAQTSQERHDNGLSPAGDATRGSTRKGRALSMPSEKLLRPNVWKIERNTTIAEVERSEGVARIHEYPGS